MFSRGVVPSLFLMLVTLLGSACAGGANVVKPHRLTVALPTDPQHLDPLLAQDPVTKLAGEPLFADLYQTDAQMNVVPDLADGPPVVSDDLATWTINLKDELYWSDKQQITSDDLIFTLSLMLSPQLSGMWPLGPLHSMDQVERKSDLQVQLHLGRAYPALLSELVFPLLPSHALAGVTGATLGQQPFDRGPAVSDGPFTFDAWTPGQSIDMSPNPQYHLGQPRWSGLTFSILGPVQAAGALAAGSVDWVPYLDPTSADRFATGTAIRVDDHPGYNLMGLEFNTRGGHIFDRAQTRQALALSLDLASIVRESGQGHTHVAGDYLPVPSWATDPAVAFPGENLDQARALLQQGGWTLGADGIEVRTITPPPPPRACYFCRQPPAQPQQQRLSGSIQVRSGDDVRLRACTLIASAARNVGMDLQCQEADTPTFWNPLRAGTFDLAIVEMPVSLDPGAALTAAFDPSQITPQSGGQNYSGYSSGAVHRLLDTAANTLTPDLYQTQVLRGELLDQAQEAVHADLPALPLYSQDTLEGFARTIAGRPHVPSDFFLAPGVNSSVFYDWRPAPPRTS